MLSVFRFSRGGVLGRVLGVTALAALLFVAGCGSSSSTPTPTVPSLSAAVAGVGNLTHGQTGASYSITVSNAAGAAATSGTITVTDPPTNFTVTAVSGTGWACVPPPTVMCTRSDALPAGQSYPPITVTGNVTGATGQPISIPITISGGGITSTVTASPSIPIVAAPAITSGNSTTFTVGTGGTFTVTATGFPAPTFTEMGALPSGVTLNSTTGVLSGTPAAGSGGSYPITITAQNSVTPNATQSFTLTVDQAPAITSLNSASFVVGAAGTFTVAATGFPAPTLSETGTLPTGVTFNASTGVLSGTPASGTQNSYNISFTAQNGIGSNATQSFTLTVGLAPAITSASSTTFTVGTAGTFTVTGSGFPAPTFSETGALPSGVTLSSAGVLSGTPAAGTGRSYSITITASNGVTPNATQSFTLAVDQAPAFTNGTSATFTVGTGGTFTVMATGFPAPTFSETGALPSGVTLNSSTGVLSGTPASGTQGSYPIQITAQNGVGTNATQNFTLTVDLAPAITSASSTTFTVGTAGTFTVTANGFPAPTFSETGTLPSGVSLNSTTGVLSGTPGAGSGGTYLITITAQNGVGANATQSFTLTVDQAPAITSASSTTFAVGSASSFTVTASGFPAPTFSETGTLPTGVSFNTTTGVLSGTPASGTQTSSPYSITFTAQNGVGSNAAQNFTLNVSVTAPPAITSANTVTFTAGATGTFTVTATGSPTPALTKTGSLPSGVNFTDNGNGTATISGSAAAVSSSSITITASNGTLPNATQTFTFNVVAAPAITSFTAAAPTITAGGSTTLTGVFTGGAGSVNNAVGTVTSGTAASVSPAVTTTYTLTVTNAATTPVSVTATATVTVVAAPVITSFTATSGTIVAGNSTTITPTFSNGTGSISPTVGAVTSGTGYSVSPTTTTTYTLTVTNSAGSKVTSTVTITVNVPPQITSANSAMFTVGVNGTFTVTTTGTLPMTLTEAGSLPSPITFVDNGNGTATISGTPTSASVNPITITASNGFGSNATQSFTLSVTASGGQISGQIFLSNTCGSVTLPTFTVTINTTPVQQVQTDTNGNYSFASVPNGTYTITPSITGAASSLFYPVSFTGVVVNGGSVSGENFNAVVGYNVSGNVSYSGSQTGQTYLYLQSNNCGGGNGPGTSITQATLGSGGAYTIHGVQPGNYTLYAWMDSTGVTSGTGYPGPQGQPNANDPTGSNSSVSVTNANVTGAGVTMSSPTYSTPNANPSLQVFPNAGGVTIFYNPPSVNTANGNKEEDANEYLVEWALNTGTDSDGPTCGTGSGQFASVAGSHTFYAIGAHGATVWILNNTVAGSGTFVSGNKYCFQAQARNTLASTISPSGWGTYTDSLGNPAAVTIPTGAPTCTGTCTTVSGTVTIPAGVTIAAGAPLYVGLFQQSPSSHGPSAIYATEITSPVSGANSYSIAIPSGSNYTLFGILDQNKDGLIDAGDVTDTNNNGNNSTLTVSGTTMTGVDTTLPGTNSTATVQTQYSSCGTNCSNYNLNLQVREANKLPVSVTLYSGPNLLNPVDMGQCSSCGSVQFDFSASLPGGTPNVGDTYNFTVTYSDGSVDQGSAGTINGKVTAFGSTGAVVGANDAPTNLSPSGTSSTSTTPNFTWTFPANPSNYTYSFYLSQNTNCTGNCTIWQIPGQNSNSNGFTYAQTQTGATTGQITWNTDPTLGNSLPSGPLISGDQYSWSISVQDTNGNQAQASVNYTP